MELQAAAHWATLVATCFVVLGVASYIVTQDKKNKAGIKLTNARLALLATNDELVASVDALLKREDVTDEKKVLAQLLAIRTYLSDIRYGIWLDIHLTHGINSPLPS